jgi:SAM-dependent methyltransferase
MRAGAIDTQQATSNMAGGRAGRACPVCGSKSANVFFRADDVPVHCNRLWETADAALAAPRGDIALAFCGDCGMVFNAAFDAATAAYDGSYENALHFSGQFRAYAEDLARRLVQRYELQGKRVVEIGCGDGDFLRLLCDEGATEGVGFDPGHRATDSGDERLRIIDAPFSVATAGGGFDFACCRHVLEHVEQPVELLRAVREALGGKPGVPVYFEVPNGVYMLREYAVWDVIYEHFGYFTPPALRHAFAAAGYEVRELYAAFANQYLAVEAVTAAGAPACSNSEALNGITAAARAFSDAFAASTRRSAELLRRLECQHSRVVLWGAGSKGVTFLNLTEGASSIEAAVDVNPRKQGRYVAGAGTPIVGPEALRRLRPDIVLLLNPVYEDEVRLRLQCEGVAAKVMRV